MHPSAVVALHFSRLVSQVLAEPANAFGHRAIVRDVIDASTADPVTLRWDDWRLVVDDEVIHETMPGVRELVARMAAHGLRAVVIGQGAKAAHVLGAASILAQDPVIGDGGSHAVGLLDAFGASAVRFIPVASMMLSTPRSTTAAAPADAARPGRASVALEDMDLHDEVQRPARPKHTPTYTSFVPPQPQPAPLPGSTDAHLARLRAAITSIQRSNAFEALLDLVQKARAERRIGDAVRILSEVMDVESAATPDVRREFGFALRRVLDSGLVGELAAGLPKAGDLRPQYMRLLAHFNEDAVEPLVEQLARAEQARERRIFFDAIVELGRGVRTLIRMLGDERWYVVRNAAELLGKIGASEAEQRLISVRRHPEPRVRRSVASALTRLGTASALSAVAETMSDPVPEVRIHAILALADCREPAISARVIRALDAEQDPEVQRAIYGALGKIATPDAVGRLVQAAAAGRGFFRKAKTPVRVAAVRALAEANTPQAVEALRSLATDREPEVRETAAKGLAELRGI